MTKELETRWMVTCGDCSVIVPGHRVHAREAYVAAAPMLGHPHFSEVTCEDIGPVDTYPALPDDGIELPSLGPQEFIPHDNEPSPCAAVDCLPIHMRPADALATARQLLDATVAELLASKLRVEQERDMLAGQVEELSREREEALKELDRLRANQPEPEPELLYGRFRKDSTKTYRLDQAISSMMSGNRKVCFGLVEHPTIVLRISDGQLQKCSSVVNLWVASVLPVNHLLGKTFERYTDTKPEEP